VASRTEESYWGSLINSFVSIPLSDGGEADKAMGTKELFCRWLVAAAPRWVYLCESVLEVQALFGGQKIPGAKK